MVQVPGVVSIQGDFDKHIEAFQAIGFTEVKKVREPQDLEGITHLVIPGGESTTVGLLMERFGLASAIGAHAKRGLAVWGTCMGMILIAREVEGRVQPTLNLLDITIRRNAFGAQVHSFEDEVKISGLEESVMGVFIRAPVVIQMGQKVEVLGNYKDQIVAVRQGSIIGTSFHPELTEDRRFHQWFIETISHNS